jgi:glycosyltransferase involved in cell wall biosynthesis
MSLPFPPEDGIGYYVYNLSRELVRKGHNVTIITRGQLGKTHKSIFDQIEVYQVSFLPLYPFHTVIQGIFIKRLLKKIGKNFDIIHYHTPLVPKINAEIPTITTVHTLSNAETKSIESVDPYFILYRLQSMVSYFVELRLLKSTDKITCVSSSVANELNGYKVDPEGVQITGNGVDSCNFIPDRSERNIEPYLLYVGRLSYRKGLFDFIECANIILDRYPNVHCKIVGKGPLYNKVSQEIEKSANKNRIQLLGYVERGELIRLYQNAAVYVLPSYYEGLPTTMLEAMSCGIPVVATSVSGNVDAIESGKNGLLVPAKSPEALANAVSFILDNEKASDDLAKNARATIEQKFTWDAISDKYIQVYYTICKRSDM